MKTMSGRQLPAGHSPRCRRCGTPTTNGLLCAGCRRQKDAEVKVYRVGDAPPPDPEPELQPTDDFCTYFIQAEHGGPVKIGVALDPKKRCVELQTGNPYKLVVRHVLPFNCEAFLHVCYAAHRLTGEWFDNDADVLADAAKLEAALRDGYDETLAPQKLVADILDPGWDRWRPTKRFKPRKHRRAKEIPTVELVAACLREGWSVQEIVTNYGVPYREVKQFVELLTRGMAA